MWQWDNLDPFGVNAPNENPSGQGTFRYALRFPGQYYDVEVGTHHNYFRDYDPAIGRYEQSDPMGILGGVNTYVYVGGNPIGALDPYGLAPQTRPINFCELAQDAPSAEDPCCCQKKVYEDLCNCYRDHPYNVLARGICTEKAYFKKSNCIRECATKQECGQQRRCTR
jgi:RHS repeat-associated protein